MKAYQHSDLKSKSITLVEDYLYFYHSKIKPASTDEYVVVNYDSKHTYQPYNNDFGPLSIGHISYYCQEISN